MNTNKKIIGATVSTPLGIEAIKKLIGDIGGSGTPFHYTTQPTVGIDGIYEALNKEFCSSQDIKAGEIILHKFGLYKVVSVTDTYYSCTRIVTYVGSDGGTQFHYSTEQTVEMKDNGQYGLNKKYCSSSSIKEGEVILHRIGLYKVVSSDEYRYYCDVLVIFSGGGGSSTPLHYSNEPNPTPDGNGMILLKKIFCSSEDIKNGELIIYNGGLCEKLGGDDTQFLCNIVVEFSGGGGSSITITDISESTESGGDNVVTFSDGNTLTVKNGNNGNDGKSAYQYAQEGGYSGTEAEFSAILANSVDKRKITLGLHVDGLIYLFVDGVPVGNGIALPEGGVKGDVVGNVDSANNIVLMGNLADGTYTVKYEMEDGSTVNIGTMVLDSNVYYSITKNLTNCTISNSTTSIVEGNSYSATISANDGYELKSVTVTMGGSAVSVTDGVINIASVTGNIVITAVAEEKQAAEPITENITLTNGIRIGSDGGDRTQVGYCATPHIDLTNIPKPCTIHLTKAKWAFATASETGYIMYYATKTDGSKLEGGYINDTIGSGYFTLTRNNGSNIDVTVTVTSDEVAKIRFSGGWSHSEVTAVYPEAQTTMLAEATLTYTPK